MSLRTADTECFGLRRLQLGLPSFTRWVWTSDRSRELWEPRFQRVLVAWEEIQVLAVQQGLFEAAVVTLAPELGAGRAARILRPGLAVLSLGAELDPSEDGGDRPRASKVVVGRLPVVSEFEAARSAGDSDRIATLLGCPDCCQSFLSEVVESGLQDTLWPMATRTRDAKRVGDVLEVACHPATNLLWRWFGVRIPSHLPCSFDCAPTLELGERLLALGWSAGLEQEMEWTVEILSWPVEWSAFHGIAEIKSPVLKVSTTTDGTAGRYAVHCKGTRFPDEGARGLGFAFRSPNTRAFTRSAEFERGLANPIVPLSPQRTEAPARRAEPRKVVTRRDGVREQQAEGDLVLHFEPGSSGWILNDSAASIWKLCDGTRTPREIARELEGRLGLPEGALQSDVDETLNTLRQKRLAAFEWTAAPSP